jgi:hypothetical protein
MLKTETLKLVRKFVVLSLMIFSLAVMSSGIVGNRVAAAAQCCSVCDSMDCWGCDTVPGCRACERAITACYRFCTPGC